MKFTWIALPGVLLLSACSSSQPNAPKAAAYWDA